MIVGNKTWKLMLLTAFAFIFFTAVCCKKQKLIKCKNKTQTTHNKRKYQCHVEGCIDTPWPKENDTTAPAPSKFDARFFKKDKKSYIEITWTIPENKFLHDTEHKFFIRYYWVNGIEKKLLIKVETNVMTSSSRELKFLFVFGEMKPIQSGTTYNFSICTLPMYNEGTDELSKSALVKVPGTKSLTRASSYSTYDVKATEKDVKPIEKDVKPTEKDVKATKKVTRKELKTLIFQLKSAIKILSSVVFLLLAGIVLLVHKYRLFHGYCKCEHDGVTVMMLISSRVDKNSYEWTNELAHYLNCNLKKQNPNNRLEYNKWNQELQCPDRAKWFEEHFQSCNAVVFVCSSQNDTENADPSDLFNVGLQRVLELPTLAHKLGSKKVVVVYSGRDSEKVVPRSLKMMWSKLFIRPTLLQIKDTQRGAGILSKIVIPTSLNLAQFCRNLNIKLTPSSWCCVHRNDKFEQPEQKDKTYELHLLYNKEDE